MASYERAAELYDLLYADEKDYGAEAEAFASLIRERNPAARSILDVGCGTGAHARHFLDAGFEVDGVDVEPEFVEIASARCPEGSFVVRDMAAFELPGRYDAVTCLFSSIGYARTASALREAIRRMRRHLAPGGMLLVDPWFEPGRMTDGWIATRFGRADDASVCRMSRTVLIDATPASRTCPVARLEFEYLVGTADGIERRSEVHELGLFTQRQMESAFTAAGLAVERLPEERLPGTRGLYIGSER